MQLGALGGIVSFLNVVGMCLNTVSDQQYFILSRIISILQNQILLEYCLTFHIKHLAYKNSIENSRLKGTLMQI